LYNFVHSIYCMYDLPFVSSVRVFTLLLWRCSPTPAMASTFLMRFLDHTQWRTKVGRTPLDEWSARRRDLCLTTHNNHNRQTSMPPAVFEPTISAGNRPQIYALDRAATVTGYVVTQITCTVECLIHFLVFCFKLFCYTDTENFIPIIVVYPKYRSPLPPGNIPGTHFC